MAPTESCPPEASIAESFLRDSKATQFSSLPFSFPNLTNIWENVTSFAIRSYLLLSVSYDQMNSNISSWLWVIQLKFSPMAHLSSWDSMNMAFSGLRKMSLIWVIPCGRVLKGNKDWTHTCTHYEYIHIKRYYEELITEVNKFHASCYTGWIGRLEPQESWCCEFQLKWERLPMPKIEDSQTGRTFHH